MAYEFTRKTDNVDDVMAVDINELQAALEAIGVSKFVCNGRLTLQSGVPVGTTDQVNKTTLYFTPYNGNEISLYDGTNWIRHEFTERSLALGALTASKPHDIFIYDNSGTLTLSATEWTDGTTRATALALQDGIYVKTGATGYRYLGTIYMDSASKCHDTTATRYVWNLYNQKQKPLIAYDLTDNWVYTTATWRAANNNTAAGVGRFNFVLGLPTLIFARVQWIFQSDTANVATAGGICLDNTNSTSTVLKVLSISQVANVKNNGINYYEGFIAAGFHYLQRTEYSAATGATTWYGDNGNVSVWLSGMTGLFIG